MKKKLPSYISNRLSVEDLSSSRGLLQFMDKAGRVTQQQAAEELGLSAGTCNLHFQKLDHMGLIHRVGKVGGRGRSTIEWEIDVKKNLCIEIVFDVPYFLAALTDFDGTVLFSKREDLTGLEHVAALEELVDGFIEQAKSAAEEHGIIRQVFTGLPGILDSTHSMVIQAANFPVLNGVDFKTMMKERHDLLCECGSLGMAYYYGELELLPPQTHAMVVHWDLGLGVVAGIGERIVSVSPDQWLLADIGHIRIKKNGRHCHCGGTGCLEAYTGGWAMIDELNRGAVKSLDSLRRAIEAGDPDVLEIAQKAAFIIGESLCWPIQVRDSQRLIITGPLSSIYKHVCSSFEEGLATLFTKDEIVALNPLASIDSRSALQKGAARLARRLYIYLSE